MRFVVFGSVLLLVVGCAQPTTEFTQTDSPIQVSVRAEWVEFVKANYQENVKGQLKAPATAQFPVPPSDASALYYPKANRTDLFTLVTVDAQNSYGALIRDHVMATWSCEGDARTISGQPNWEDRRLFDLRRGLPW